MVQPNDIPFGSMVKLSADFVVQYKDLLLNKEQYEELNANLSDQLIELHQTHRYLRRELDTPHFAVECDHYVSTLREAVLENMTRNRWKSFVDKWVHREDYKKIVEEKVTQLKRDYPGHFNPRNYPPYLFSLLKGKDQLMKFENQRLALCEKYRHVFDPDFIESTGQEAEPLSPHWNTLRSCLVAIDKKVDLRHRLPAAVHELYATVEFVEFLKLDAEKDLVKLEKHRQLLNQAVNQYREQITAMRDPTVPHSGSSLSVNSDGMVF